MKFEDIRVGDRLRVTYPDNTVIEFDVEKVDSGEGYIWGAGSRIHVTRWHLDKGSQKVELLHRPVKVEPGKAYRVMFEGFETVAIVVTQPVDTLTELLKTPIEDLEPVFVVPSVYSKQPYAVELDKVTVIEELA